MRACAALSLTPNHLHCTCTTSLLRAAPSPPTACPSRAGLLRSLQTPPQRQPRRQLRARHAGAQRQGPPGGQPGGCVRRRRMGRRAALLPPALAVPCPGCAHQAGEGGWDICVKCCSFGRRLQHSEAQANPLPTGFPPPSTTAPPTTIPVPPACLPACLPACAGAQRGARRPVGAEGGCPPRQGRGRGDAAAGAGAGAAGGRVGGWESGLLALGCTGRERCSCRTLQTGRGCRLSELTTPPFCLLSPPSLGRSARRAAAPATCWPSSSWETSCW